MISSPINSCIVSDYSTDDIIVDCKAAGISAYNTAMSAIAECEVAKERLVTVRSLATDAKASYDAIPNKRSDEAAVAWAKYKTLSLVVDKSKSAVSELDKKAEVAYKVALLFRSA